MIKYRIFQTSICLFIAACLFVLVPPTYAQASASCANVRCASGTCIDTPAGPTCTQQTLTCASTLCVQGTRCVETTSGPQCVANQTRPVYGHGQYQRPYHYNRQGWRRHYQPYRPRNYTPYRPYRPRVPHRPRYGHGYVPPRPKPPTYGGGICTRIYQPVCAQKQVQCFRAPCPPVRQTFSNACEARNAGYSIIRHGVCHSYR